MPGAVEEAHVAEGRRSPTWLEAARKIALSVYSKSACDSDQPPLASLYGDGPWRGGLIDSSGAARCRERLRWDPGAAVDIEPEPAGFVPPYVEHLLRRRHRHPHSLAGRSSLVRSSSWPANLASTGTSFLAVFLDLGRLLRSVRQQSHWNTWVFESSLRFIVGIRLTLLGGMLAVWGMTTVGWNNTSGLKGGFVSY